MKILLVCTGNVCRSPLAEGMLRAMLAEKGRGDIAVSSAGTSAATGDPASEGSYLVALEHGVDLSPHSARLLTRGLIDDADLILVMGEQHARTVHDMGGAGRVHLLGRYAGREMPEAVVEDPFGGDIEDYRRTYEQLAELLPDVVARLARESGDRAGPRGH